MVVEGEGRMGGGGAVINEGMSLCYCMCCQRLGPRERKLFFFKLLWGGHQAAALPQGSPQECNPVQGTAAGAKRARRAGLAVRGTNVMYTLEHVQKCTRTQTRTHANKLSVNNLRISAMLLLKQGSSFLPSSELKQRKTKHKQMKRRRSVLKFTRPSGRSIRLLSCRLPQNEYLYKSCRGARKLELMK